MRIIHGSGFEENDRLEYKKIVFQNIYDGISKLGDAMDLLNIQYKNNLPEVTSLITLTLIIPHSVLISVQCSHICYSFKFLPN